MLRTIPVLVLALFAKSDSVCVDHTADGYAADLHAKLLLYTLIIVQKYKRNLYIYSLPLIYQCTGSFLQILCGRKWLFHPRFSRWWHCPTSSIN